MYEMCLSWQFDVLHMIIEVQENNKMVKKDDKITMFKEYKYFKNGKLIECKKYRWLKTKNTWKLIK